MSETRCGMCGEWEEHEDLCEHCYGCEDCCPGHNDHEEDD